LESHSEGGTEVPKLRLMGAVMLHNVASWHSKNAKHPCWYGTLPADHLIDVVLLDANVEVEHRLWSSPRIHIEREKKREQYKVERKKRKINRQTGREGQKKKEHERE
jgi:hypothetical protein